jgi:hypothetical protein
MDGLIRHYRSALPRGELVHAPVAIAIL